MKVAGRIAMGYAVLIVLLVVLFTGQISVLRQMQAANRRNSGRNFQVALAALQLIRDRDAVEEWTIKYMAVPATERKVQLKEARDAFQNDLAGLQSEALSQKERAEAARLRQFWLEFTEELDKPLPAPDKRARTLQPAAQKPLDVELAGRLDRLRAQAYSLYQASIERLSSDAESSRKAGERAELVLWFCAVSSLVVGLMVSGLIVRSIAEPLRNLTEGARALAEGKEFYRLDTSRNDELSQIARDINALTRRLKPDHPTQDGNP